MIGQTVGKYRVVSRLGRGGMGTVYKAVDETLGREVAIKRLNQGLTEHEVLKRFRAEAVTLARLNHPNIATLFELTELDGEILMVMEFVRGESFEGLCERLGAIPIARAVELCSQVFDALAHAHRAGIVHRDLKPANLMLAESGVVKVMDFGLARMAGSEHLTNDGYMVGTPAYMSPEQVLGGEVDGRADLYAMGVVLYRLLSGQLPFKARSGIEMAHKQMYDQPTPVRQLRTELPAACEAILLRALAKQPEDRFQTADEFRAALAPLAAAAFGDSARSLSGFASAELAQTVALPAPHPGLDPELETRTMTTLSPATQQASSSAPAAPPESPAPAEQAPGAALPATGSKRGRVAAVAVAVTLLLVAVPVTIFLSRGRNRTEAPAQVSASATPVADVAPSVPPVADATPPAPAPDPPVAPGPTSPSVTEPAAPAAASPSGAVRPAPKKAAPPTPAAPASKDTPVMSDAAIPAPPPPPTPAIIPAVTFPKMKILLLEGGKARDRDASLRLDAEEMHVMDGAAPLKSAAYRDVIAVYQSHSREPRWTTPDGTAVAVAKTGGKFSFFKGVPDWITVRTRDGFIPLRVDDGDLSRVIAQLEARTGVKVVRMR